jgi:hypothetical protein
MVQLVGAGSLWQCEKIFELKGFHIFELKGFIIFKGVIWHNFMDTVATPWGYMA